MADNKDPAPLLALSAELPELPKSYGDHCVTDSVRTMREPGYTADQMRAYATEAAAYWYEMHRSLLTAYNELLAEKGWLPIESAPNETDLWLFDAEQEPSQFVGRLTEGHDGPYWRPAEQLVADVMAEYMHPTHWQPLPPAPGSDGGL